MLHHSSELGPQSNNTKNFPVCCLMRALASPCPPICWNIEGYNFSVSLGLDAHCTIELIEGLISAPIGFWVWGVTACSRLSWINK